MKLVGDLTWQAAFEQADGQGRADPTGQTGPAATAGTDGPARARRSQRAPVVTASLHLQGLQTHPEAQGVPGAKEPQGLPLHVHEVGTDEVGAG